MKFGKKSKFGQIWYLKQNNFGQILNKIKILTESNFEQKPQKPTVIIF